MKIRQATVSDLDGMVEVDRKAFGEYGSEKKYFIKKLSSFPGGVLVFEDEGKITGFFVFEILAKNDVPEDFCDIKLNEPIKGKWMHAVAFTGPTNYKDKISESKLLLAGEKIAKGLGCVESYVPLSKNHPFKKNGVFKFWELNSYKKVGEIKWKCSATEFIECFLYKKSF
ncbi:MAG: hypothetical protein PHC66_00495 [Candidatus Nanoarchaeia archaeon]|nr:hypothetical protein [Candidatus Nanoarchaeia archaeon]MDD5239574.1 hypothetical protein [Candidatus Nanoarchaeia archaeon]